MTVVEKVIHQFQKICFIPEADLELLKQSFVLKNLRKSDFLVKEGEYTDYFWYLSSGIVCMFKNKDRKSVTVNIFNKPRFFSDLMAIFSNNIAVYNVQALKKSTVLGIKKEQIDALFSHSLYFERLGRIIYEQVMFQELCRNHELLFTNAAQRYQNLLCQEPHIEQYLSQREIAAYLNITPETLCRLKSKMLKSCDCK